MFSSMRVEDCLVGLPGYCKSLRGEGKREREGGEEGERGRGRGEEGERGRRREEEGEKRRGIGEGERGKGETKRERVECIHHTVLQVVLGRSLFHDFVERKPCNIVTIDLKEK